MKKYFTLILFTLMLFSACDKNTWPVVFKKRITYKVSGTANDYWITYVDELGNYKNVGAKSTWKYEFKARPNKFVYLSAKNNTAYGTVKVEILQNDNVIFTSKTELPFGAATVSGYVK